MSSFASPLQIALVAAAVTWPFAAGLGVVLWSRARAVAHANRQAVLSGQLRSLYRSVESWPLPPQLRLTVEAIEEQEAMTADLRRRTSPAGQTPNRRDRTPAIGVSGAWNRTS
jgi:hypothetical protein